MARDTKERTYKLLSGQMKRLALTEDALNEEIRIFSKTAAEKIGLFCKTSAPSVESLVSGAPFIPTGSYDSWKWWNY